MAYSPDAVRAKLATLNETQDSIVSVAQWLLFHRRHADRTAQTWLAVLQSQSSIPKRLNLIYLANEVVQQSRARGKQDFVLAFEPIVSEGVGVAYRGANEGVQGKVRRVVEVWRQRGVFDVGILDAVEGRLGDVDRSKGAKSGAKLGGSLFGGGSGGSVPVELEGVSKCQVAVSKAEVGKGSAVEGAEREWGKMTDPIATLPTPPVHAARLSALMRNLASAQGAVEASIVARRELLEGLEKLVAANRAKLEADEATVATLATRKEGIEGKKKEVEDGIMRGLSNPSSPGITTPTSGVPSSIVQTNGNGAAAPEAESFTPPPPEFESSTRELSGQQGADPDALAPLAASDSTIMDETQMQANPTGADSIAEHPPTHNEPSPSFEPPPALSQDAPTTPAATAAADAFMTSLSADPRIRAASSELPIAATNGSPEDPRLKRRKMSHPKPAPAEQEVDLDDIFGAAGATEVGVDEEGIAAMLGS